MPFIYKGTLAPGQGRLLFGGDTGITGLGLATLLANSAVVRVGDVISVVTSGNTVVTRRYNAAGDPILGVLTGVAKPDSTQATPDSGTTDTWTADADNETVAKLYAIVDISPWSVYSAPSSAALHTTAVAGLGAYTDPDTGANAGRIAEGSVTRTLAQGRGVVILGVDPDDSTRALVSIGGPEHIWMGAS